MKDEITLLREENKRLNTIIYVLTEKLQETETSLYAYLKNNIGINNVSDGIVENNIGVNNSFYAYDKNNIGVNNVSDDTIENNIGVNNSFYAYDKNNIGVSNVSDGIIENKVGVSGINTIVLASKLKAVMIKCPTSGLGTAAKTLVHIYTNPKCPQKDLMVLTGLSADGIVKHIRALKKRNLIIKVGFQQYTLSDAAIKMLEVARG